MRIAMNIGGDVPGKPSSPPEIVDDARRAEADGFGSAWSVHYSRGYDALTTLAVAGVATTQIDRVAGDLSDGVITWLAGPRAAQTRFSRYGGLDNYRRVLERAGVESVAELAIVGTESDIENQLRRYAEVGVTELWPAVFPVGENAAASISRTRTFLSQPP